MYISQQSREIAKLTADLRELKQNNEDLKQKVLIFQSVSYFVWLPHIVILTKSVGFVAVVNKVTHCPRSGLNLLPTECDAMLLNTTASARFPFCSKIRREKARETVRSLLLNPSATITLERS